MKKICSVLLVAFLFFLGGRSAFASVPEDFAIKGVVLGEPIEAAEKAFGEPLFDKNEVRFAIPLKRYVFDDGFEASTDRRTQKIVEIKTTSKTYTARARVRYGATSYYIQHVYGKAQRQQLDGAACFIYANEKNPHERLILTVDHEESSLLSFCLTALPLTEEEADTWQMSEAEDSAALTNGQMKLDLSHLPKDEIPHTHWEE